MSPSTGLAAVAAAGALLVAGIALSNQVFPGAPEVEADAKPPLGLFTSLPIYWAETEGVGEILDDGAAVHWARTALGTANELVPLDTLDGEDLGRLDRLVMAQPRPLAPIENVALDDWVRGGGRLLLFADPFLTQHSRFMLGDKRRPQDMVLMSPILRRWGLELHFDEDQPQYDRDVAFEGAAIPVRLAGTFTMIEPGAPAQCTLGADAVIARCRIGRGEALLVADADLFDGEVDHAAALAALTRAAFFR